MAISAFLILMAYIPSLEKFSGSVLHLIQQPAGYLSGRLPIRISRKTGKTTVRWTIQGRWHNL